MIAGTAELVKTENGARGFFVTYPQSEVSIVDNFNTLCADCTNPDGAAEPLVKKSGVVGVQAVFQLSV